MSEKKIVNGKEYVEIEFCLGMNIEQSMRKLYVEQLALEQRNKSSVDVSTCGNFNGHILTSDMTIDDAYINITGKTQKEKEEEEKAEREAYLNRKAQHEAKIQELTKYWEAEGLKVLSGNKLEEWNKIVPIRLRDIYEGMELKACLDLVRLLNGGTSFVDVNDELDRQGHSGMSYSLVVYMVKIFAENGEAFCDFIIKNKNTIF